MKYPDFIIAGFGRCGTSALLLNLAQNSDIQIPDILGTEIRFWTKTLPEIKEALPSYKEYFHGKISGEKTPGYIMRPYCMKNISEHIPDVKIILCMRDPVKRAISHFELHKRFNRIPHDKIFEFKEHMLVSNLGLYLKYIKASLLPFIPMENVHFIIMEWMKKDLKKTMSDAYEFLGADPFDAEIVETEIASKVADGRPYMTLFKDNNNYHIWSHSYFEKTLEEEKMKMYKYFKSHNQDLFDFLGYEIKEWRY